MRKKEREEEGVKRKKNNKKINHKELLLKKTKENKPAGQASFASPFFGCSQLRQPSAALL